MSEPIITPDMIEAALDQSRVDSGLCMTAPERMERVLRAALTGQVDRKPLHTILSQTCPM